MINDDYMIKCIDALVCLNLKSQPCRAINSWSTRCSSHLPTTRPAAQPHIPRTTITSEDASRKLFNGDQLTTASLQTITNLSTIVSYFQNANSIEIYWNHVESVWYLVCNVLVSWTFYYVLQTSPPSICRLEFLNIAVRSVHDGGGNESETLLPWAPLSLQKERTGSIPLPLRVKLKQQEGMTFKSVSGSPNLQMQGCNTKGAEKLAKLTAKWVNFSKLHITHLGAIITLSKSNRSEFLWVKHLGDKISGGVRVPVVSCIWLGSHHCFFCGN